MMVAILVISGFLLIGCNNDKQEEASNNNSDQDEVVHDQASNDNSEQDEPVHDVLSEGSEQDSGDYNEVTNLTFSEAIEEYPIWYEAPADYDDLERDDNIIELYYFENGKVTVYNFQKGGDIGKVEDMRELSIEEIIEKAEANNDSMEEHEYTLTHTLDAMGQGVEDTFIKYSGDRNGQYLNSKIISQPLYDKRLAGFQTKHVGSSRNISFFTIVEDEHVRIRLGDPEEDSKENITVE